MEKVTGIGGVFFTARDKETLIAWYREMLGLAIADEGYAVLTWSEPAGMPDGATVFAIFDEATTYFEPARAPFMVNFRVADVGAMVAQLRAKGADVEDRIEDTPQGRFAWVIDPEGHRVELWEPAKEG
jgi:predicted enzyme related to lactoylglutathione lyase